MTLAKKRPSFYCDGISRRINSSNAERAELGVIEAAVPVASTVTKNFAQQELLQLVSKLLVGDGTTHTVLAGGTMQTKASTGSIERSKLLERERTDASKEPASFTFGNVRHAKLLDSTTNTR